jgi:hypothetical protein
MTAKATRLCLTAKMTGVSDDLPKFGNCWLCGQYRKLTREHIPAEAAFNDRPILWNTIRERSVQTGRLEWQTRVEDGLVVRSLSGECNSRGGAKYGTPLCRIYRSGCASR